MATNAEGLPVAGAGRPSTTRGEATRQAIIDAARRVFEEKGFVDARITDIVIAAGVATGSFYTYFADKEAVLAAVFGELQEEMLYPQFSRDRRFKSAADVIEASHRVYLETYRENAALMALREEVAAVDGEFREARRARAELIVKRNARLIERLQAGGYADATLDPHVAAMALSVMVSRAAYTAFVLGDEVPLEQLVATLTRLWVNGLGIAPDAPAMGAGAAEEGED